MTVRSDTGDSAVEYALLLAGIVAVVVVSVLALTRVVGDSAAPTPCP